MESHKNFAIYKASAGSGKTSTLIGIFLKLALQNHAPAYFKRILAVTFTNKAAYNMKETFLKELDKIANLPLPYVEKSNYVVDNLIEATGMRADKLQQSARRVFAHALQEYGDIAIGTIDGFNHKLIRSFSRELDLPSDFEVELEEDAMFQDAIDRLLSEVEPEGFMITQIVNYLSRQLAADKKPRVRDALTDLKPLVMSDEGAEPVKSLSGLDPKNFEVWGKELRSYCKAFENRCAELAKQVFDLLESQNLTSDDLTYKKNGWYGFFKKLQNISGEDLKITLHGSIKNLDSWAPGSLRGSRRAALDSIQPQLTETYDNAVELLDMQFATYATKRQILIQIDLLALLGQLNESLTDLKEERNILPISEFNRLIASTIRTEPVAFIYERFGSAYNHILIDEFQDTGELQWKNMIPLVEETLGHGHFNMVVGDAKQSIYRWRGGKAEQLIILPELDPDDPDISEDTRQAFRHNGRSYPLDKNFRSHEKIVEFNNAFIPNLGANILSSEIYRAEYSPKNVEQKYNHKKGGLVEVRFLGKNPEWDAYMEALMEQIQDARNAGFHWGDMAILVRGSKEGGNIASALSKAGISFTTAESFGMDQSILVQAMIGLMRLSIEPEHEPSKIRVMRVLCHIHNRPYNPNEFLYDKPYRAENARKKSGLDFVRFVKTINPKFSMEALQGKGAFDLVRSLSQLLIPQERTGDFMLQGFSGLIFNRGGTRMGCRKFLNWWDAQKNKPVATGGEVGDRIQIQTIHKSKGLKYRICFLPFADWKYAGKSNLKWFPISDTVEDGIPYAPLPMSANKLTGMGFVKELEKELDDRNFDNLNLLYVALTRAVERLYINYGVSKSDRIGKEVHEAMKGVNSLETVSGDESDEWAPSIRRSGDGNRIHHGGDDPNEFGELKKTQEPEPGGIEDTDIGLRFDLADDSLGQFRDLGIRFHGLIAHGGDQNSILKALHRQRDNGELEAENASELETWVRNLFGDKKFAHIRAGAKWLPERSFVYKGEVLRPDLILDHGESAVVLDFKTGKPLPRHEEQISAYRLAAEEALSKPVRAHLIYLSPLEWREVTA